ncbi:signal recognition particle-docking protein FtsY [Actinokineospora alba]|uniref:Signal recognition particle receptor FtsY n=1 Tax=Actinokineospora alba TaxID=504798 RepID=A0A1H0I3V3_9PSEU|nr:signal recognition particle-docking protein FtsY [Actinokineospora alba]TDP64616.1 fused signal recognition particle receptor [Actinokineospora alba]SDI85879.1 fused signal recognition particle receptor [Actinokineospora alba]SDO26099.1 signal recognition particle-docking protein FtsY [Actinokineospora alba]
MSQTLIVILIVAAVVLLAALVTGVVLAKRRRISLAEAKREVEKPKGGGYQAGGGISLTQGGPKATPPPHPVEDRTEVDGQPGVGDDASVPRDSPRRGIVDVTLPEDQLLDDIEDTADKDLADSIPVQGHGTTDRIPTQAGPTDIVPPPVIPEQPIGPHAPDMDEIAPTSGRLERLRGRLSRSRSAFGQGLLGLLGAGDLDEDSWTEVEDTLLLADLGAATTQEIVDRLRSELVARAVRTPEAARAVLREVLIDALHPDMDRAVRALPHGEGENKQPAVALVVGVNGTGKTTTTGKLARVLVADGRTVVLAAADTFRAAAADQLQTWADRVGAEVVRGKEGADPAAVAFDAVKRGIATGVDTVLIDTAGRLHTKTGLMDELGKVKRVVEKQAEVDEVLLVLDATTGQNGLTQARVFGEVVDVTGIVLTKLDGTAKGGIVFQVQRELGVPVKLVGLGEGADDLAPFDPAAFVDALLG